MKLSAVIIVKDREKVIERCLESIKDCDEIIVSDTGSTDNTIKLCKKYTDKVYTDYKWNDDFAEARNHAASYATGDWIFVIDSDEWLDKNGIKKIRKFIDKLPEEKKTAQVMANNGLLEYPTPRLYKRNVGIEYHPRFPIHEILNFVDGDVIASNIKIYADPKNIKDNPDPDRNLRILKKALDKYPEEARLLYYLGKEYASPVRGMYKDAIECLTKYLSVSRFRQELEDSYLVMAYCYDQLGMRHEAKIFAGEAVISNPNNRQAIMFTIELADEKHKKRWQEFLENATDEDTIIRLIKK